MLKCLLASAALALAACSTPIAPQADPRPVIEGGLTENGLYKVLGVEYATAARWELPVANADWESTSDFDSFGPACPQAGQTVMVEDCLFLNIFTPEVVTDNKMPVLVWIHGGGFIFGEGGDGPQALAKENVVVVTFNYRLGKLGFQDWAGWNESDPRNFGQADMVAALDWVQANIARLGGDPENVTIAGHSAGGMGVQLMMVDPRATGKFARAWSHAGYGAWPFAKAYNPSPEERQRIRYGALETAKTAEQLVAELPYYHLPYIDAPFLKRQPVDLFEAGKAAPVPYVAGANSYDGAGTLQGAGFTPESFIAQIDSAEIRSAYAEDFAVSDLQAAQRIFGDLRYLASSLRTAKAEKGWMFYYDEARENPAGATHGQQYDRLFGTAPFAQREALLSFIKLGDPEWRSLEDRAYARFSPELTEADMTDFDARLDILSKTAEKLKP